MTNKETKENTNPKSRKYPRAKSLTDMLIYAFNGFEDPGEEKEHDKQ